MSCDAELQELMVQVDKMVEEKKSEWQEKIKNAEIKLNNTLQENFNLKSIIEDKNGEIENFKNRIKYKDNMVNMFDYDQEVLQLRLELSQIKKSYEKYYHKYTKKTKEIEREKEELCKEKIDLLREVNELRNFQKQFCEEKIHYEAQIKEFELKKNFMLTDRDSLNEQLKLLKSDFNLQLAGYVESEKKYMSNTQELQSKLNESKLCLQREMDDNKMKISEIMQHMKKTLEEKQQIIIDNESAKRMIIRLENELSRISSDNKIKEKTICKMDQVIKSSEKTINEKNEVIRALQVNSASKDYVNTVSRLESELLDVKSHLKMCKKTEKSFQIDVQILQKKLKDAHELVEYEKNQKIELEKSVEQLSKTVSEKAELLDKITNLESVTERKSLEITSVKAELEKLKSDYDKLLRQLNEENKINDQTINRLKSPRKGDEESCNPKFIQSNESMIKERTYLLKFCEDKDLIIQRLQMENRILQEFISKLNSGLSDEIGYCTPDQVFDNYATMSDVFNPLKETFTEYDPPAMVDKPDNSNHNNYSKNTSKKQNSDCLLNSTDSFSNLNFYQSHEKLQDNVNKSSDEFLSNLVRSDSIDHRSTENEPYLNVYPTLAAAKYFTEEREKTRQIEKIIDFHMNQLKKETENKRCIGNQ